MCGVFHGARSMSNSLSKASKATDASGPWPFVTVVNFERAGQHITWQARSHRKGLGNTAQSETKIACGGHIPFWQTNKYNWLIGGFFSVGALLFMLGSFFSILPEGWPAPSIFHINLMFFVGCIPLTIAIYLQHFQSANSTQPPSRQAEVDALLARCGRKGEGQRPRIALIGWYPASAGWLSTFTQLLGVILFDFDTWDALYTSSVWYEQDVAVWAPDMIGSVLFLLSGYIAFIETCGGYWVWRPDSQAWRIVFINLVGCIAFMVSAVLAFVPIGTDPRSLLVLSALNLLIGASCFYVTSRISMRESWQAASPA